MTEPVTEVIPPDTDDGDGDSLSIYISSSVSGPTGDLLSANLVVSEPSDDDIAEGLIKTALAAAQLYGAGAWIALQQRLKEAP